MVLVYVHHNTPSTHLFATILTQKLGLLLPMHPTHIKPPLLLLSLKIPRLLLAHLLIHPIQKRSKIGHSALFGEWVGCLESVAAVEGGTFEALVGHGGEGVLVVGVEAFYLGAF